VHLTPGRPDLYLRHGLYSRICGSEYTQYRILADYCYMYDKLIVNKYSTMIITD